ncbi:MAG: DUF6356 family protein [Gammaproteobacteria bacterium]|nr:DUF6356 family protein [Gammaproteobacteria bacterium]
MKLFTEHTQQQGVTYMEHLVFAVGIAIRLLGSAVVFLLHGIFPFVDIRKELDLEATRDYLDEQNDWIEGMKENKTSVISI